MQNARFYWTFPTTRQEGGPLDPADIIGTEIAIRVVPTTPPPSPIPWSVLDVVNAPGLELTQDELTAGDYEARAIVLTDDAASPVRGAERVITFRVDDNSPAAAVDGFGVELT